MTVKYCKPDLFLEKKALMVSVIKIKRRILDFIHNVVSKYSVLLFFPV